MIGAIVAVDMNGLIGYDGRIPWHEPQDLKRFKEITTGSVVIMGRKTFESIGKCLPNRVNIVVSSRGVDYWLAHEAGSNDDSLIRQIPVVSKSLEIALDVAKNEHPNKPVWIIGGAQIYKRAFELGVVKCVEMTTILRYVPIEDASVEGMSKAVYFDQKWLKGFRPGNVTLSGNLAFVRHDWHQAFSLPKQMESIKIEMKGYFGRPPLGALLEDKDGNQWVVISRGRGGYLLTTEQRIETVVLELHKPKFDTASVSWPVGDLLIIQPNFRAIEELT